jgi:hypothetical protein
VVALVYAAVAVAFAVSVRVYRRATAGVSGPSVRQQQFEGVAILVSFVLGSPVLQGALEHYGASDAIVYGVIPAAAPLIIVGTTALGIAASKADWPQLGPHSRSSQVVSSPRSWDRAARGSQPGSLCSSRSLGTPPRRASGCGAHKERHRWQRTRSTP